MRIYIKKGEKNFSQTFLLVLFKVERQTKKKKKSNKKIVRNLTEFFVVGGGGRYPLDHSLKKSIKLNLSITHFNLSFHSFQQGLWSNHTENIDSNSITKDQS